MDENIHPVCVHSTHTFTPSWKRPLQLDAYRGSVITTETALFICWNALKSVEFPLGKQLKTEFCLSNLHPTKWVLFTKSIFNKHKHSIHTVYTYMSKHTLRVCVSRPRLNSGSNSTGRRLTGKGFGLFWWPITPLVTVWGLPEATRRDIIWG